MGITHSPAIDPPTASIASSVINYIASVSTDLQFNKFGYLPVYPPVHLHFLHEGLEHNASLGFETVPRCQESFLDAHHDP
jgi:hypothetical protein